ncbi:MAG: protein kinase [Candidatus Sericytochromatia bacterium]|nr:protein kinase [Candidatus Sericytochromatia bacterium]
MTDNSQPTDEPDDAIELTLSTQIEGQAAPGTELSSFQLAAERYQLLQTLGAGAMGEVLAAQDQNLRRKVAYKQIHAQMAVHPEVLSRFVKEAQITAQLGHPNIIPIYDLETHADGKTAYTMKLIQGKTLKELIQAAREDFEHAGQARPEHSLETLLGYFLKVCDAMHYAHVRGVIHRDLKPANLMVGPYGEVYVMDWGIARLISEPEASHENLVRLIEPDQTQPLFEQTQMGKILGTPRYMSPQQAAGKNEALDGRSDLFALGLILFEMVCLKPAFQASDQLSLLKKVLKAEKETLVHPYRQPIAPELAAIIHKATARKPEARYRHVAEMADDLRRYLRGEAVLARPDNLRQKLQRWMGQHPVLSLGLLTLVLVSGVLAIGGALLTRQQAIETTRWREQQTYDLLNQMLAHTQSIDSRLIYLEGLLRGIGSQALDALEAGAPQVQTQPVYHSAGFRLQPSPYPPDLARAPAYQAPISLDQLVFHRAPGTDWQALQPFYQKLSHLAPVMRRAAIRSALPESPLPTLARQKAMIQQGELPLVWLNLGWEAGLMVTYPGSAYQPAYDPRLRPWYRVARNQRGPVWGKPYPDAQGQGLLLTCSLPLYDQQQRFVGVGALDLLLDYMAQHWLPMEHPAVTGIYLLNQAGQVVSTLRDQKPIPQPLKLNGDTLALADFGKADVIKGVQQRSSGYLNSGKQRYFFARLETLQ